MGIQYKFHDDYPESILVRNFVDLVNVDDIIDSWEYLIASKLINDNIKGIINNLTGCSLDMNLESFRKLIEYLRAKDQLKKLKLAWGISWISAFLGMMTCSNCLPASSCFICGS